MSPDEKFGQCDNGHRLSHADHRLCDDGDWCCNVCKETFDNSPGFKFFQCRTCHDDYCTKGECQTFT